MMIASASHSVMYSAGLGPTAGSVIRGPVIPLSIGLCHVRKVVRRRLDLQAVPGIFPALLALGPLRGWSPARERQAFRAGIVDGRSARNGRRHT